MKRPFYTGYSGILKKNGGEGGGCGEGDREEGEKRKKNEKF